MIKSKNKKKENYFKDYLNLRYLIISIAVFLAYFSTARIGLSLDAVSGFATSVWPPAGIALAVILIFGYRYWPSISLAAFLVNLSVGAPLPAALGIGIGNTLEALAGSYMLKNSSGFKNIFRNFKDIFSLVVFSGFISPAISATIGVSSLYLSGIVAKETYSKTWFAWWTGDFLGVLVIASLILVLFNYKYYIDMSKIKSRLPEAIILFLLIIIINLIIFNNLFNLESQSLPLAYIIFPFLIWASIRFCRIGAVASVFITSVIAIIGTVRGFGPFIIGELSRNLLFLQIFIGVIAIICLITATISHEKHGVR